MDYNRIAQFVRVVRAGSFTAAAAELELPKSSLSRAVSNLERDLGVRLLHRTTRKLTLTEVGQTYYESVRGPFESVDSASEHALEHDTEPRGVVRISAAPDFAGLAIILARFTRKYPGIQIDARLTTRYVDLLAEGIDLAVRAGRLEDSSLVARKLGTTEMGLMAAPSYLRRRGRPKTIDDLSSHDWVLFRARASIATIPLVGRDGERTVDVHGGIVADDMAFCRSACEAGAGIARLPIAGVDDSLRSGKLEWILPEWTAGGAQLWLVMPSAQLVPRRVALLRDYIVDQMPAFLPKPPSQRGR